MSHYRKLDRLTEKQIATVLKLVKEGYDRRAIGERFGITRQEIYTLVSTRGPGCYSSRRDGLDLRSSLADDGQDPARCRETA